MSLPMFASNFTLDSVTTQLGNALQPEEMNLNAELQQLQSNPNPSQQDLVIFQATMQIWTNLIQMESSIVKVYGDTMKQVVTNMGS